MNVPPVEAVRVPPAVLQQFVAAILSAVGMEAEHASLLAHLLVTNDLRGVFSHGTRQVAPYARDLRAGTLNPRPQIQVLDETPTTFAVDGDGGLGYFAAWRAAHEIVDRARTAGVVVAVTRNHGHIGAAGLYPASQPRPACWPTAPQATNCTCSQARPTSRPRVAPR